MGEARQSRLDRTARWGRWLPLALILIGVLVRGWALGAVPGGLNQDEAFAGYEAWSLLTSGVDSWGYPYPCYLVAWGSGMNALESYLAMPFLALLGCTATALRMPQFLCACLSLPVCYDLLRRMASRRLALVGLGLLAISPWHIMLSRWGLESNLAPAFLLFGFYFLVRGLENQRFLLLSAAAYGISLYAYAINWVVVPLTLCVCGAYLLLSGRRFSWRCLLGAGVILFLLALPLMLFVLVNLNVMEEIVTPWFSIPRMVAMRGSELSLSNLFSAQSWRGVGTLVFLQRDSLLWNAMDGFGMFYLISLPFQLMGAVRLLADAVRSIRERRYGWQCLVLLAAVCSVLVCLALVEGNINRTNSLHLYTLIFIAAGVDWLVGLCRRGRWLKWLPPLVAAAYACCFLLFTGVYFTGYNHQISEVFRSGVGEAVSFIQEQDFPQVAVDRSIYYPQILFYDQTPHQVYADTVEYVGEPSAFTDLAGFGRYRFGVDYTALEEGAACLVPAARGEELAAAGWQVERFDGYAVAWK